MVKNILSKKFLLSPFSIFDTIQKNWQDEKKKWLRLGIKSEVGRDAECNVKTMSGLTPEEYKVRYGKKPMSGTSIFDPFLCEVLYTWFNIEGGTILDPFAGGSVRGIVAEKLGYRYVGIELRKEQVISNQEQSKIIGVSPTWITGDSNKELDEAPNNNYDMVLTCPPYYNLEVYSDDKDDISNFKTYEDFLEVYNSIIKKTIDKTKDDRFIVYVVSNFRDKQGNIIDFVGDTIRAHQKCGVQLYNEIIMANAIGTLPVRTSSIFPKTRKIGKRHQNVLVFFKGDSNKIRDIYPHIDIDGDKQNILW